MKVAPISVIVKASAPSTVRKIAPTDDASFRVVLARDPSAETAEYAVVPYERTETLPEHLVRRHSRDSTMTWFDAQRAISNYKSTQLLRQTSSSSDDLYLHLDAKLRQNSVLIAVV
ncbi:MAG TPA: hypothetical protein VK629_08045 [Steroidobacteraceae bacterium]|nr:hypothetical protein [Steroidobacteraceae bacterium]